MVTPTAWSEIALCFGRVKAGTYTLRLNIEAINMSGAYWFTGLVYSGVYPASQLCRRIPRENAGTVLLVFGGNDCDRAGTAAVCAASPMDGGSGIYDFQHTVVAACTGGNFA